MKNLLLPTLLSVAALGLVTAPASAGTFGLIPHHGGHGCCTGCVAQYNAFSPVCCCCCQGACDGPTRAHGFHHGFRHGGVDGCAAFNHFGNPCDVSGDCVSQAPGADCTMEPAQAAPAQTAPPPLATPTAYYPGYNYGYAPGLPANSMPSWSQGAPANGR